MREFQTGLLLNSMDYFLGAFEDIKYVWTLFFISPSLLQLLNDPFSITSVCIFLISPLIIINDMVWYFRRLIFHLPCKLPGDRNSCLPQLRLNLHDGPTAENTRCVRSGLVCTGGLCSVEIWPYQCKELCAIDFWQHALELVILLRLVAPHSGISTDEFQVCATVFR